MICRRCIRAADYGRHSWHKSCRDANCACQHFPIGDPRVVKVSPPVEENVTDAYKIESPVRPSDGLDHAQGSPRTGAVLAGPYAAISL